MTVLAEAFVQLSAKGADAVAKALEDMRGRTAAVSAALKNGGLADFFVSRAYQVKKYSDAMAETLGREAKFYGTRQFHEQARAEDRAGKAGDAARQAEEWNRLVAVQGRFVAGLTAMATKLSALSTAAAPLHGTFMSILSQGAPEAAETLSGSFGMLSDTLAQTLIPYARLVSEVVQDIAEWFESLDGDTRGVIGTVASFAAVLVGVSLAAGKVVSAVQMVAGFVKPLAAALLGVAGAARTAGAALLTFAMSNPVTAILAVVGAVVAMVAALRSAGESAAELSARFEEMANLRERLEGGGPVRARDVRQAFASSNADMYQRLVNAGNDPRAQQAELARMEQELERQRAGYGSPQQVERTAAALGQAHQNRPGGVIGWLTQQASGNNNLGGQVANAQNANQAANVIRAPYEAIRAQLAAVRAAREQGGVDLASGRTRGLRTSQRFQSQIGGVTTAWSRLMTAANSRGGLEQRRNELQQRNNELLQQNTQALQNQQGGGSNLPGPGATAG